MKVIYFLVIITLATQLLGSCEVYFVPCTSDTPPDKIKTVLMPVSTGNHWEYTVNTFQKGKITDTSKMVLEVAGLDNVYYKDRDLKKHDVQIYRVKRNGAMNTRWGYLKCENGAALVKEYGYSPKELELGRTLPDSPVTGWEDPRNIEIVWSGPEQITVPAGTFECWACEFTDYDDPKIIIREYYSKGVGLVKSQSMNWKKTVQMTMELVAYKVN